MKKLFLLLSFILVAQLSFAQLIEPESLLNDYASNLSITPRVGCFTIDNAPIRVDLPSGYMYLDTQNSKDILVNYWGNPATSVKDVIGMVIPDATNSVEEIDKAWILSLKKDVGHVQDNKAGAMGFSWILKGFKNSEEYKGSNIEWAWSPHYNTEHHSLSLPLLFIAQGDTILNHRQYIFGNTDAIMIEPIVSLSEIKWLEENDDLIANAISFIPGTKYENFNENTQQYGYNSVSAFLKGIPSNASTNSDANVEELDQPSFSESAITWIGIIALILLAIMAILMIAVAITNVRKESSKSILRLGINVLLRIAVFGMVYLFLLTFAVFLIWLGVWLTIAILSNYISIKILLCILGGWAIIGSFLYAIIRSLFVFHHSEHPNRLEISESEAPKLFALIREVSGAVGEQMPKHTYVSPEVNACVFYNKPFISLFFPGRKNLEIGLGLLFGLNKQELIAVIAHEYGHFGQKSMRIGQIVSICYNIISNLVNAEGASYVRPILKKTFLYVQRGYMSLSRAMEYEADEKSATVAGNKATISALCKIEVISARFNAYNNLLSSIYESKHGIPQSYWMGYELFEALSDEFDGINYDASLIVDEPLIKAPSSRVKLKNAWISHPLLEQRIENVSLIVRHGPAIQLEPIRDLVPEKVYKETSDELMRNAGFTGGTLYSEERYKELLAEELAERSFPLSMRPFFSRDLSGFKVSDEEVETGLNIETVFSESNTQIVESFTQAISDYQTMMMFKNKQTSEKAIQYDGRVYTRKSVPVENQLEIIKNLEPKVIAIDKSVFSLAMTLASDKDVIANAYDNIFYSQAIIRYISEKIIPVRDSVAKQIGSGGNQDEQTFNRIQRTLLNFKANMRVMIDSIEMERLNPIMHVDVAKSIGRVNDEILLDGPSISGDEIEYIFTLPDQIISLFQSLAYFSKKIVSDTIEGKTPLMYWNNSVAHQMLKLNSIKKTRLENGLQV